MMDMFKKEEVETTDLIGIEEDRQSVDVPQP